MKNTGATVFTVLKVFYHFKTPDKIAIVKGTLNKPLFSSKIMELTLRNANQANGIIK